MIEVYYQRPKKKRTSDIYKGYVGKKSRGSQRMFKGVVMDYCCDLMYPVSPITISLSVISILV